MHGSITFEIFVCKIIFLLISETRLSFSDLNPTSSDESNSCIKYFVNLSHFGMNINLYKNQF